MICYACRQIAIKINQAEKIVKNRTFLNISTKKSHSYETLYDDIRNGDTSAPLRKLEQCSNFELSKVIAQASLSDPEIEASIEDDIINVIESFSMKYFTLTQKHRESCTICETKVRDTKLNALSLMMASAARANESEIKPISNPKTSKEGLYNEFLAYVAEIKEKIPKTAIGKKIVTQVVDLLYYIDGHYSTMNDQVAFEKPITPDFVRRFSSFNKPETHRHQKRELTNLKFEILNKKVNYLSFCFQYLSLLFFL